MRKVFIVLAVLALGNAAFFLFAAHHQQDNVAHYGEVVSQRVADLARLASDTTREPALRESMFASASASVDDAVHYREEYRGLRNQYAAIGGGSLVLALVFVWLARRKPRAIAA